MVSQTFRALSAALLLTTAGVAVGTLAAPTVAEAAGARPAVAKLLNEAISLAKAGNTGAASAKLREAQSQGALTAGDQQAIAQVKQYVEAKSGMGATGSKAKFAADYNAGRYQAVVGSDADELRKAGQYDAEAQLVVAQAYYQMGNYSEAIRLLSGMSGDTAQGLLMSAAAKSGNTDAEMKAAERLVLSGQSKYWPYMLAAADNAHGLSDHETLDVARLRLLTGNMRNADDYQTAAELAIQFGFPSEAVNIVKKGMDAKVLNDARSQRLAGLAQAAAAKDVAALPATVKAANASKNGDLLVKLGEDYWGMGKYPDAVNAIKAGIAKGVTNADDARLALGIAQVSAGQKDAAIKTFNTVDSKARVVAHVWSVYARTAK